MSAKIEKFNILTKGFDDFVDITSKIQNLVAVFNVKEGILNIYVKSPCASIKVIENEPGLGFDLSKLMEMIAPVNKIYQHDDIWHDGNAYAHLKSILLGNSLTLPIIDFKVEIGLYQQIVLMDFDNKASEKEIIVSVVS